MKAFRFTVTGCIILYLGLNGCKSDPLIGEWDLDKGAVNPAINRIDPSLTSDIGVQLTLRSDGTGKFVFAEGQWERSEGAVVLRCSNTDGTAAFSAMSHIGLIENDKWIVRFSIADDQHLIVANREGRELGRLVKK